MSDETSSRFALPLLATGQAHKETTHNEALARIDVLLHPRVVAAATNLPPEQPANGDCWIIGGDPGGAWAGRAGMLAAWTGGGWRFIAPVEGMAVSCGGVTLRFADGEWNDGSVDAAAVRIGGVQVVGPRAAAVPDPLGGATVDARARATLAAVLATLRNHGLIEM